jgi:hypothetical protein
VSETTYTLPAKRARRRLDERQKVTRVPPYWPGTWVLIKAFSGDPDSLSGKVRQVKTLSCVISRPDQKHAVWRVHFDCGRCLEWHLVARPATDAEIRRERCRYQEGV